MTDDKRHQSADQWTRKLLLIPSPYPLAEQWADRYPREIPASDAARVCKRSPATARAWARGAPLEPLCLHVLQLHLWGRIVPDDFRRLGIRFQGSHLHTRSDYALDRFELSALAWSLGNCQLALNDLAAPKPAAPSTPPDRRWRPSRRGRQA